MEAHEVLGEILARQGVSGALFTDRRGHILASDGLTNPDGLAATTAFVLTCATKLGDSLALGDPLWVIASAGPRHVSFVYGDTNLSALETSSPAAATAACRGVRAMFRER